MHNIKCLIIKKNFIFGVGTGDTQDSLNNRYLLNGYTDSFKHKLNAHNQYLETFIAIGLIGFSGLISLLIIPIVYFRKNLENLPLIFIDLGCGSGRHSEFFQKFCRKLIDLDESREMLKKNHSKSIKIQAQMNTLPFRNSSFDGIFSVASLHHLRSLKDRNNTIMEINRIGRRNALVSITVWRFYQKKFMKQFLDQLSRSFEENNNSEIKLDFFHQSFPSTFF